MDLESNVSVFRDKLNDCQLLKEGTAPWMQLTLSSCKCSWMNIADQIPKQYSLKSLHKIGNEQVMVRGGVCFIVNSEWIFITICIGGFW